MRKWLLVLGLALLVGCNNPPEAPIPIPTETPTEVPTQLPPTPIIITVVEKVVERIEIVVTATPIPKPTSTQISIPEPTQAPLPTHSPVIPTPTLLPTLTATPIIIPTPEPTYYSVVATVTPVVEQFPEVMTLDDLYADLIQRNMKYTMQTKSLEDRDGVYTGKRITIKGVPRSVRKHGTWQLPVLHFWGGSNGLPQTTANFASTGSIAKDQETYFTLRGATGLSKRSGNEVVITCTFFVTREGGRGYGWDHDAIVLGDCLLVDVIVE